MAGRIIGGQIICLWTEHHTQWEGQTKGITKSKMGGVLTIDACGQALKKAQSDDNTSLTPIMRCEILFSLFFTIPTC